LGFDLDRDANVDVADLEMWLSHAGAENLPDGRMFDPGDANLDGEVDAIDFGIWQATLFSAVPAWSRGDFNADGFVDGADFNIWNENKFRNVAAAPSTKPMGIPAAPARHDERWPVRDVLVLEMRFSNSTLDASVSSQLAEAQLAQYNRLTSGEDGTNSITDSRVAWRYTSAGRERHSSGAGPHAHRLTSLPEAVVDQLMAAS
jgi:hypothetical protein